MCGMWAGAFKLRKDYTEQIASLKLAFETISKALEIDSKDKILWKFYRRICRSLGIALSVNMGFAEGKPYLEKCLQTFHSGNKIITPESNILAEACFYLSVFGMNESNKDIKQIENWINLGLANSSPDSRYFDRLNNLKKELFRSEPLLREANRKFGWIKFYNSTKHYGVIEIDNESYIFFISGFRQRIADEELNRLDGKVVSFILVQSNNKKNQMIASDIIFEKEA